MADDWNEVGIYDRPEHGGTRMPAQAPWDIDRRAATEGERSRIRAFVAKQNWPDDTPPEAGQMTVDGETYGFDRRDVWIRVRMLENGEERAVMPIRTVIEDVVAAREGSRLF